MDSYIFKADIYCADCAGDIQKDLDARGAGGRSVVAESYPVAYSGDSERYPSGPYGDGGGEADTPQHCGRCGTFLDNPLTDDGRAYVREELGSWISGDDDGFDTAMVRDRLTEERDAVQSNLDLLESDRGKRVVALNALLEWVDAYGDSL